MADDNTVFDGKMTNYSDITDTGGDMGEGDVQKDDEEEVEVDPNYIEERFRVDRRKLEQMIQAEHGMEESAEDFFLRIMEDTNTSITWPSKLKIGAKSKKDPHIKVSGHRDDVAHAKEKVMTVLDTKSTRVTLKMDVSYTEHSHVIGKGGNNIKQVMQETGCHIHFPDSNRNNQAEKSNQVSIAGQPSGVEQARGKIRDLLPLVFMFDLPITGVLQPIPDTSSPPIKQIQENYGITVSFKQRPRVYMTTVIVRGTVNNSKSVKEGTMRLIEHLTGNIGNTAPVSMQLEIAPQHHLLIIGRGGANVTQIMQQTGATIHFPDPNNTQLPRKGTVFLSGPIDSVCLARQHLIGCLPLVLMFDMKEDTDIDQAKMSQLMEQLDVFISIKPKPKQPSKSVIVKGIERNAANLYEARRRLLGLSGESVPVVRTSLADSMSTNNINLSSLGLLGHNLLKINPVVVLNGYNRTPLAGLHCSNAVTTLPSNIITPQPGTQLYNPGSVVLLQQAPRQLTSATMAAAAIQRSISSGMVAAIPQSRPTHAGLTVATTSSPVNTISSSIPASSNSSPPSSFAFLHHHLHKDINHNLQKSSPPCHSPVTDRGSPGRAQIVSTETSPPSTPPDHHHHPLLNYHSHQQHLSHQQLTNSLLQQHNQHHPTTSKSRPPPPQGLTRINHHHNQPVHIPRDLISQHQQQQNHTSSIESPHGSPLNQMDLSGLKSGRELLDLLLPKMTALGVGGNDIGLGCVRMGNGVDRTETKSPILPGSASELFGVNSASHNHLNHSPYHPSLNHDSDLSPRHYHHLHHHHHVKPGSPQLPAHAPDSPGLHSSGPSTAPGSPSVLSKQALLMEDGIRNLTFQSPRRSSIVSNNSTDSDNSSDQNKRVGGTICPNPASTLFSGEAILEALDYEQKKFMATKAIAKKPLGESRTPTDYWSGLGFSKSMPDSAIRETLRLNNVKYKGPSMATTYESPQSELGSLDEDKDPWKDSPMQSPSNSFNAGLRKRCTPPSPPSPVQPPISATPGDYRKKDVSGQQSDWIHKTELAELFSTINLGKYTYLFQEQEIDMATFLTLTDQDLKELGISTFGARRKMILAIADLNKKQTLTSAAPGSNNPYRKIAGLDQNPLLSRRSDIASQSGRW